MKPTAPTHTPRSLIEQAASDPALTIEGAAVALLRFTLQQCAENPDRVRVGEAAEALAAAGKILEAGGQGNDPGAALRQFLQGGDGK